MMTRATDLRADYRRLGMLLKTEPDGAKAAALARERRMISDLLETIEAPKGVSVVDELATRRQPAASDVGAPSRRRRSRGS